MYILFLVVVVCHWTINSPKLSIFSVNMSMLWWAWLPSSCNGLPIPIITQRKSRVTSLSVVFSPFDLNVLWDPLSKTDSAVFKDQQIDHAWISHDVAVDFFGRELRWACKMYLCEWRGWWLEWNAVGSTDPSSQKIPWRLGPSAPASALFLSGF